MSIEDQKNKTSGSVLKERIKSTTQNSDRSSDNHPSHKDNDSESNASIEEESSDEGYNESSEGFEEGDDEIDFIKTLNRQRNGRPDTVGKERVFGEESNDSQDDDDDDDDRNNGKSEKTKKRKRRATSPTSFGLILSQALEASEKSNALGPSTTLNQASRTAQRLAKEQASLEQLRKRNASKRHERQERGHIRDVIGGWTPRPALPFSEWLIQDQDKGSLNNGDLVGGASHERSLRRLAQTGVVKLFNAIRAAQDVCDADPNELELSKLSGAQKRKLKRKLSAVDQQTDRASSIAELGANEHKSKPIETDPSSLKSKPNVLGTKGKAEALANLSKASFLELIKSSGSKT
ncbi:Rrp15p-domain-containing protein [Phakopsora pachyrhizi]|uniref:Rrp15p-domain-containing protein n=1 Tax=Phakopsora pachyrhizi TaxID=170000 RepID=A0AAV0B1Q4_PHAPC|nr:Rrp15p-domain-containing protein [Phakopsora pachyrhizi]